MWEEKDKENGKGTLRITCVTGGIALVSASLSLTEQRTNSLLNCKDAANLMGAARLYSPCGFVQDLLENPPSEIPPATLLNSRQGDGSEPK